MASASNITPTLVQQPDLAAFIIFDQMPPGCIPFFLSDSSAEPLLYAGDTLVIDTSDREPSLGELFVIEWGRSGHRPQRRVVETFQTTDMVVRDGERFEKKGWNAAIWNRARSAGEGRARLMEGREIGFVDGPYKEASYLSDILIGRVIGIYQGAFAEPLRVCGEARR